MEVEDAEEVKDVEDVDSLALESYLGGKLASFGLVVGGYYSLAYTQSEEKETAGNSSCRPFDCFQLARMRASRAVSPRRAVLRLRAECRSASAESLGASAT